MDNTQDEEGAEAPEQVPADVEAARDQIEETRAEMSETIDAIEEKLSFERIKGHVRAAVREATVGKAQQMAEGLPAQATRSLAGLSTIAKQRPREVGALSAGVTGSIALLVARARKQQPGKSATKGETSKGHSSDSKQVGSNGSSTGKNVRTRNMSEVVGQSQDRARTLTNQFRSATGRTTGARAMPKTAQQITKNLQYVAQQNLLTMAALVVGAGLTSIGRLLDTKRTQSRTVTTGSPGPLLAAAAIISVSAAGVGVWGLARRKRGKLTGQDLLLAWLNDAYGMEIALSRTLQRHVKDARDYPEIQTMLQQHLEQTRHHADLVKSCIKRLGGSTSSMKTTLGAVVGKAQGLSARLASDQLIKNALADVAAENFEVASYAALIAAAQELGDEETVSTCQQVLREDQEMARWIEERLPMIARETLVLGT